MNRTFGIISLIASLVTIGDAIIKIATQTNYNFFTSIIWIIIITILQIAFTKILNIKIEKKDSYIPYIYFILIPFVFISAFLGYQKHINLTQGFTVDRYKIIDLLQRRNDSYKYQSQLSLIEDKIDSNYHNTDKFIEDILRISPDIKKIFENEKYFFKEISNPAYKIKYTLIEILKLSIIITTIVLLFIFWATICDVQFHKNPLSLSIAYGIPSLLILSGGINRYIIKGQELDKYSLGFIILLFLTVALAFATKNANYVPLSKREQS